MDNGLSLFDESASYRSDIDGQIFQVKRRDLDYLQRCEVEMLLDAFLEIAGKDLTKTCDGYTDFEVELEIFRQTGVQTWFGYLDDELASMVIMSPIFPGFFGVRMLYVSKSKRGHGIGTASLENIKHVHSIMFQTRTDSPPKAIHRLTEKVRKKIYQTEKLETFTVNREDFHNAR
jgi:GNAT superfamily N-acetyltransferase